MPSYKCVQTTPDNPAGGCGIESPSPATPSVDLGKVYALQSRVLYALAAMASAVLLAGFWSASLADGFGRDIVTAGTIGNSGELGGTFASAGFGFGVIFAAVAGLAATFTACNCVVFAMLPGLAATGEPRVRYRRLGLRALGVFTIGVLVVSAAYGMFVGFLGADGIAAFNARPVRLAQASAVFSVLGVAMLAWGAFELGLLTPVRHRLSPVTLAFLAQPTTKAALLGLMVGTFAVGRPFPVMRDFLAYAATAESPLYGASMMMVQGLGQIGVMAALFLILVLGFGRALERWMMTRPQQPALVSAMALIGGGTFFIFYWGLSVAFDIGRWGVKLGWYS